MTKWPCFILLSFIFFFFLFLLQTATLVGDLYVHVGCTWAWPSSLSVRLSFFFNLCSAKWKPWLLNWDIYKQMYGYITYVRIIITSRLDFIHVVTKIPSMLRGLNYFLGSIDVTSSPWKHRGGRDGSGLCRVFSSSGWACLKDVTGFPSSTFTFLKGKPGPDPQSLPQPPARVKEKLTLALASQV